MMDQHVPDVQKVDSAIHRINLHQLDSVIGFTNIYPLDSDLSTLAQHIRSYSQPRPFYSKALSRITG